MGCLEGDAEGVVCIFDYFYIFCFGNTSNSVYLIPTLRVYVYVIWVLCTLLCFLEQIH